MIGHSKHLALNTLDRSCPSVDCKDKIDVPDRIGPLPRTESAAFPGPPSRPKSCGTVTDRPQSTQALATPWVEHGEQVASGATSPSAPAPTPPSQALGAATTRALPCENVDLKDAYIQVPLDETEIPICKLTPNHTSYVPQPPGDAARRHGGESGLELLHLNEAAQFQSELRPPPAVYFPSVSTVPIDTTHTLAANSIGPLTLASSMPSFNCNELRHNFRMSLHTLWDQSTFA